MAQFKAIQFTDLVLHEGIDKNTGEKTQRFEEKQVTLGLKDWQKEELPTTRFWLMLKLRNPDFFERRWYQYIKDLKEFLAGQFTGDDTQAAIRRTIEKLERSAWNTMPASFLSQLGIPRAIRR